MASAPPPDDVLPTYEEAVSSGISFNNINTKSYDSLPRSRADTGDFVVPIHGRGQYEEEDAETALLKAELQRLRLENLETKKQLLRREIENEQLKSSSASNLFPITPSAPSPTPQPATTSGLPVRPLPPPAVNETEQEANKRVIHFLRAARDGDLEKVMEYLKLYKDLNPSTCNQTGLSAFHLACKGANIGIVTEFLRRGANVDASTKNGNTPLHIAALAGHYELVTLLVSSGATVNVQSQNGITPLYMAAQEGYLEVVKYLLDNGASQSLCAEGGFTPLIVAKQQGHKTVVETLLERGGAQSAEPLMPNVQNKVDINTKTSCSVQ